MFIRTEIVFKSVKVFSDGSLIKNINSFNQSKLRIDFLEKDFKFKFKNLINKKTQSSNILSRYRKNIFN